MALLPLEPCSAWSAVHDLAALGEGNLSRSGKLRLAQHLAGCRPCKVVLASLISDARAEPRANLIAELASRRNAATACYLHVDDPAEPPDLRSPHVVLVVAANPWETGSAALDEECAAIRRALARTVQPDTSHVEARWTRTCDDLRRHVEDLNPTIIHFSGHGDRSGVVLQDEHGRRGALLAPTLAMLVATSPRARAVVFNGCYRVAHAEALAGLVSCVIGMSGKLDDADARSFAAALYRAIGDRTSIIDAVEHAVATVNLTRSGPLPPNSRTSDDSSGARGAATRPESGRERYERGTIMTPRAAALAI